MRVERLDNMKRGWFVGNFAPTLVPTEAVEVAVKTYAAGEAEDRHYHKIATEITVVIAGTIEMNGVRYESGDMIVMEPGESTDFRAISAATNVVVKIPGATNDKYPGHSESETLPHES